MLSGIGPTDQLQPFGIPTVLELPGVGQNLWNHLSAQLTFKVKDGIALAAAADAVHFSLHYTSAGSSASNDMVLRTSPVVDARQERVPGVRTRYLNGDVPPDRVARISCTLGLPDGAGYVRLASADPRVQPAFHYRYLQHPNDMRRVREGLRLASRLLASDAYKDVAEYRIHPTDAILADDDALDRWIRQTVGTARHVSGTCKMGPDADPMAVVDQYCRVKGVQGLWVVDASVMPRIPRSGGCPCHGGHDRRTGRRLDCGPCPCLQRLMPSGANQVCYAPFTTVRGDILATAGSKPEPVISPTSDEANKETPVFWPGPLCVPRPPGEA